MNNATEFFLRAQNRIYKILSKGWAGFAELGRSANAAGKPWGLALYARGCKAMLAAEHKADAAGFSIWREKSGFPAPGWGNDFEASSRACGVGAPCSFQKAVEAPDAPWSDSNCQADFMALFSCKASQIANDPLSSLAASWALARIPKSSPEIRRHFLENLARMNPQWAQRKKGFDPVSNLLFSHPDAEKDISACAHASAEHEAELERNALSQTLPANGPASALSKNRI